MRQKRKRRIKALLLCWLAALVIWGVVGTVGLAREVIGRENGGITQRTLAVDEGERVNLEKLAGWGEGDWLYAATSDPQLIWQLNGERAGLVRFAAEGFGPAGGEMVLYYTTRPDEPFSEAKKQWAARDAEGRYVFDLGGRKIEALRWDPGTTPGAIWRLDGMDLNPRSPAWRFYLPDVQAAVLLLLLPPLCYALLYEIWAFLQPAVVRRRFENRWKRAPNGDKKNKTKAATGEGG